MYSGHLGNMIGLIELLYGDFRWDQDFVLVPENGDESQGYHYDFQKIAERFKE